MPGPGSVHLDDEVLNAVLDGEADAHEAAHARSCSECSDRLERFRRVAVAVAAPVEPVAGEQRRAAVSTALRVGHDAAGGDDRSASPVSGGVDVLAQRRRRRWAPVMGWAAAAASVAVLAVAVPLLVRPDVFGGQEGAATSAEEGSGAAGSVADDCAGCESAPVQDPADGGDLGDLGRGELDDLAERLDDLTRPPPGNALNPAPLARAARPEATSAGSSEQATSSDADTAPADTAPAADEPVGRCEGAARGRDGGLGPLYYTARARLDGVDVLVLGFGPPAGASGAGRGTRLLVLAAADCAELASASA